MNNDADYTHFSRAVAPLLAAFTLPTIAVIVTTPASDWNRWRYPILCLFLASTGLLLASVQFAAGCLFKPGTPWNEIPGRPRVLWAHLPGRRAGPARVLAAQGRRRVPYCRTGGLRRRCAGSHRVEHLLPVYWALAGTPGAADVADADSRAALATAAPPPGLCSASAGSASGLERQRNGQWR